MPQAAETYPESLPLTLQKKLRDILAADPYYAEHRIRILLQDEGEIGTLLASETGVAEGLVLLVCISELEADPPNWIAHFTLLFTEDPTLNRSAPDFDTALGAAAHTAELLIPRTDMLVGRISHTVNPDSGLFQATVELKA